MPLSLSIDLASMLRLGLAIALLSVATACTTSAERQARLAEWRQQAAIGTLQTPPTVRNADEAGKAMILERDTARYVGLTHIYYFPGKNILIETPRPGGEMRTWVGLSGTVIPARWEMRISKDFMRCGTKVVRSGFFSPGDVCEPTTALCVATPDTGNRLKCGPSVFLLGSPERWVVAGDPFGLWQRTPLSPLLSEPATDRATYLRLVAEVGAEKAD